MADIIKSLATMFSAGLAHVTDWHSSLAYIALTIAVVLVVLILRKPVTIWLAPGDRRADLTVRLLDEFGIDHSNLTRQQKYNLAILQLGLRTARYALLLALIAFVGLSIVGAVRPPSVSPPPPIDECGRRLLKAGTAKVAMPFIEGLETWAATDPERAIPSLVVNGLSNASPDVRKETRATLARRTDERRLQTVFEAAAAYFDDEDRQPLYDQVESLLQSFWETDRPRFRSTLEATDGDLLRSAQIGVANFLGYVADELAHEDVAEEARGLLRDCARTATSEHARDACGVQLELLGER